MIERYSDPTITAIWKDQYKVELWQQVELCVIRVQEALGLIPGGAFACIEEALTKNPPDLDWWKAREKETGHDLNAWIDERVRFIPSELHQYFHKGMTSYDTEELPFQLRLLESADHLLSLARNLENVIQELTKKYRLTPMLARTHGQEAKIQSFGKRAATWLAQLRLDTDRIVVAIHGLRASKLSGAVGNYQGISAEVEEEVLKKFGFRPFYGATQIMPRNLHANLAQQICNLVMTINKIAMDIRLGARSGHTILQEPFGKQQKGSSAMPHKKNPIATERVAGMTRLAETYMLAITMNIETWEERAIEQSCVERIVWPDLFHVGSYVISTMTRLLNGLVVNKEVMMDEIAGSRGVYASEEAKDFLKVNLAPMGLSHEDAYRIVQLAAFNAFAHDQMLDELIVRAALLPQPDLACTAGDVFRWNEALKQLFTSQDKCGEFADLFEVEYHLRNEGIIFEKLGV